VYSLRQELSPCVNSSKRSHRRSWTCLCMQLGYTSMCMHSWTSVLFSIRNKDPNMTNNFILFIMVTQQ
jgi:hypothetical protein